MSAGAGAGWGALAQFGTDLMNVGHSAIQNRKARKFAKEFAEFTTRNTPTWRVEGLKAAGLNPILAAGGLGAGGGPGGGAGMIGGSASGGYANAARTSKLMNAELRKLQSEAKTALWNQKVAKNTASASDFLPQRAQYAATNEQAIANTALAQLALTRSRLPYARGLERYYEHPTGQALQRWSETMRNLFGQTPKPMPIYRGK